MILFGGDLAQFCANSLPLPLHAKLDLWLCLESTQNIGMTITPFFSGLF